MSAAHDLVIPQPLLPNQLLTERKFPEVICEPHVVESTVEDDGIDSIDRRHLNEPADLYDVQLMSASAVPHSAARTNRQTSVDAYEQERKAIEGELLALHNRHLCAELVCIVLFSFSKIWRSL